MTHRLTNRQKWQLALSVFAVYWPIRLYVNISAFSWSLVERSIPFWLLETILSILFFYSWINVTEWLQQRLFKRSGEGFLIEFKIPAQLATLAIASALAVVFNIAFYTIWHSVDDTLQKGFGLIREQEPRPQRVEPTPPVSEERRKNREQRRRVNNGLTVMAMLSAFYLAANRRAYRQLEDVQVRAERLEKENVQAQFAALKSQVNPHFLFNSLSILSSLVHADADLSEKFIDQLSRAYRYILEQKDNERVLLKTELEFIQAYRFLLNIRFENKFDVVINVPEADQSRYSIAPLTLQLLVENAVKHNRMSAKEPLHVYIQLDGENLIVQNNLQPRPQSEHSTGVGLQNIITRYALLTDQPVWVGENEGDFIVKIPLLNERIPVSEPAASTIV
ncbi:MULTISPECIES: sensor histidine kinase [Spirosoma]|uniref:Histidine kinase n=1 Tax=Spirosoma liriopis TaxID=2937440 RepID=A0ABT0HDW7_9BACT|nr:MULTISPECIES: histidine kinase [Spirosoma]MCK8490356.1 histidine kinase [Spirosoma liriopis]UHG93696.1 histidine kinase [Spirosoma oryzicola]